jgi:hypothetical protein
MLRSAKRMPRRQFIVRPVRGQQQHFRTEFEEGWAPLSGHRSRRWTACRQGRSQADEVTAERVTSEWHQGQVVENPDPSFAAQDPLRLL